MHCRLNGLARGVHQQFREPFEDHLDLLGVWLGQVGGRKRYADIVDTSCDFFIGLRQCQRMNL